MRDHERDAPRSAPERAAVRAAGLTSTPAERVLSLQRTLGNRRTTAVVRQTARPTLQRYKILGPFNKGQAVHETLTVLAVGDALEQLEANGIDPGDLFPNFDANAMPDRDAQNSATRTEGAFLFDPVGAHASVQQFIRGVVWADDPKGLLFDREQDATDYSSGTMWAAEFLDGKSGKFRDDRSDLISRSHFGDLQFFHGMATKDGEAPATTKANMLMWARFLVDVATNRTTPGTPVKNVVAIKSLFPANADWTIKRLFGYAKGSDVEIRQRAVGVLFHMIQDSFAAGHVERDASNEIVEFHAYGGQDEEQHGKFDFLAVGSTLRDSLAKTKGAPTALQRCTEVLKLIAQKKPTDEIVQLLDEVVFKLAAAPHMSGPGTGLGKPTPPAKK